MDENTNASTGSDGTPGLSPSLMSRMLDSSKKKRKASPLKAHAASESQEEEALGSVRESLVELSDAVNKFNVTKGRKKAIMDTVRTALTRLDEYAELRLSHFCGPSPAIGARPPTKDADTDMELTPEWWVPTRPVPLNGKVPSGERPSKTAPKSYAEVAVQPAPFVVAAEDGDGLFKVVERRRRKSLQPPNVTPAAKRLSRKPPAVLVKVPAGGSYAETVKMVKDAVNPTELGVDIAAMRMAREGHLLLEVGGGDASASAEKLKGEVADKVGSRVGGVAKLGDRVAAEVLGLDPTVDEGEVRTAMRNAIICRSDDPSAAADAESITITGLWSTKAGTQIATAGLSVTALDRLIKIGKIAVGWTMVRIRQRDEPPRCYRCHGFGHTSGNCSGPNMTGTCRRCGETGHGEKECTAVDKTCVACERSSIAVAAHRPGSARCEARKTAVRQLQRRTERKRPGDD